MSTLARPLSPRRGAAVEHSLYFDLAATVRSSGLLDRRHAWYWWQIIAMVSAFTLVWAGVWALGNSWFQLLLAAALGLVVTQFGFLGHDGAHQQMFRSPRWNEWTSRLLSAVFAGLAYGWWRDKHNRHHANPNKEGRDPDVASGTFAFTPAVAESFTSGLGAWFVRHQGWLFFPLLTLEGLNLHASGIRKLIERRTLPHRRLELSLIVVRLAAYVVALAVLLPPGKAVAFFGVQMAVFGLCLGGSFAPNHKGMPIVPPTAKIDFLRRQVLTSRNVRGSVLVDFLMGGLDYQIEHHLFPSMPRPNLKRLRPLVREYCAEHDVPYAEVGLFESYSIVVGYLNHVGLRARGPFECPMAAQLRG